ncbi:MAG TPA: hypothetical protein VFA65_16500 [Bryobacteraceae bacterium]|nr:hypothetical protein [Bryobacteraceae bacterium]
MNRYLLLRLAVTVVSSVTAITATTIDFEAQGATAPSAFNSTLNSPLVIGIATFTGGKLLKGEVGGADATAVYATTGFIAGYTDPLIITFSQPVSNVSLVVTNETPDTYTLMDNLGGSAPLAIGNNINQTLSLNDIGVTQVSISTAAPVNWDFAIDNVSFTTAVTSAPEPLTVLPIAGFLGVFLLRRRACQR